MMDEEFFFLIDMCGENASVNVILLRIKVASLKF